MRKAIVIIAALAAVVSCSGGDKIRTIRTSENTEADFGKIKEADGPVTVRLLARNESADTLFPVRLYTPCACTEVKFDRTPVPPGEDEVIEVSYNPAYRPGKMMEEIQVYYAGNPLKMRSFIIVGEVIGYSHPIKEDRPYNLGSDFYVSHKKVSFGTIRPGETKDFFFRYGNGGSRRADVRFEIPEEWRPYLRLRQPGKMKADQRDTVHVKFTAPATAGEGEKIEIPLQPVVNGKAVDEAIQISARVAL